MRVIGEACARVRRVPIYPLPLLLQDPLSGLYYTFSQALLSRPGSSENPLYVLGEVIYLAAPQFTYLERGLIIWALPAPKRCGQEAM